jgi:cytochrome o ubiquinol oxidase subunit 2
MPGKRQGPARRDRSGSARAGRCAAAIVPLALAACEPGVLDPRGVVGIAEKEILIGSVVIMLAIVVPTIVATLGLPGGSAPLTRAQSTCRISPIRVASS